MRRLKTQFSSLSRRQLLAAIERIYSDFTETDAIEFHVRRSRAGGAASGLIFRKLLTGICSCSPSRGAKLR